MNGKGKEEILSREIEAIKKKNGNFRTEKYKYLKSLGGLNSRMAIAEKRISEFENKSVKIQREEKRF